MYIYICIYIIINAIWPAQLIVKTYTLPTYVQSCMQEDEVRGSKPGTDKLTSLTLASNLSGMPNGMQMRSCFIMQWMIATGDCGV